MSMIRTAKHLCSRGFMMAAVAALFLVGCHSGPDPRFTELPGTPEATGALTQPPGESGNHITTNLDIIHENDAITIIFTDLPNPVPPLEDRVRQDGTITLLQNQTFHAAGKTRSELEKEIRDTYVPKFYKTMTVTVKPTEQTRFYYVGGEVRQPNRQVYLSRVTVLKAIQSAGDFTDFAAKTRVELTRANGTRHIVNCKKAQKDPALDLEVYPGDRVWVPRRWF